MSETVDVEGLCNTSSRAEGVHWNDARPCFQCNNGCKHTLMASINHV